jgi:hypothetical protein
MGPGFRRECDERIAEIQLRGDWITASFARKTTKENRMTTEYRFSMALIFYHMLNAPQIESK